MDAAMARMTTHAVTSRDHISLPVEKGTQTNPSASRKEAHTRAFSSRSEQGTPAGPLIPEISAFAHANCSSRRANVIERRLKLKASTRTARFSCCHQPCASVHARAPIPGLCAGSPGPQPSPIASWPAPVHFARLLNTHCRPHRWFHTPGDQGMPTRRPVHPARRALRRGSPEPARQDANPGVSRRI